MSQGNCVEVLSMASEKFSAITSSSDEEEVVVKRKKKKSKLKSPQSLKPDASHNPGSSDEEESEDIRTKTPPSIKKKPRRIQMDSSSEEDEEENETLARSSENLKEDQKHSSASPASEENSADRDLISCERRNEKLEDSSCKDKTDSSHESGKSDDELSKSTSESENSSDDDSPPLRLFRNKNPTTVNETRKILSEDKDLYDDEGEDEGIALPDPSEIAEPHSPKRKSARRATMMELQSETQRLVRESSINLPYHRPQPKKLSEFMKRPTLGKKMSDEGRKEVDDIVSTVKDDLPDIGDPSECHTEVDSITNESGKNQTKIHAEASNASTDVEVPNIQPVALSRPLTSRERLLQQLGSKLPELKLKALEKSPGKFIDLAEDDDKVKKNTGVTSLMHRFMKHAKAGRRTPQKKKEVELNIIRKEERSDGTGVDLVPDVVKTTVGDDEKEDKTDLSVLKTAQTPGQRLQLLRQQLAQKMKKRREIERKKREELHKLDNEEIDQLAEEEDEEDCDWSEGDTDEEEEELAETETKGEEEERTECRGNGIIESSDESDIDENENDTEPFEGSKVKTPSLNGDISLPREGSVLLFEDSTRSSASTLNKSGRLTPAFDRTCSDDSFYSSMIPLHQPEVSNISDSSHFAKPHVSKGEFDDTCFENDSRSLSQPFRLDFEASQSQLLDANGFIRESTNSKLASKPLLPPGAEDDNAMTDCNISQLLDLCSAPFDTPKTQNKSVTNLLDNIDSGAGSTQELLGLCSGNFSDSAIQYDSKDDLSGIVNNNDITADELDITKTNGGALKVDDGVLKNSDLDVSNIDENSGDLFKPANVNESFGFNMLSGNQKGSQSNLTPKSLHEDESASDDEDDKPITIVRTKKFTRERIAQEFVENEAELSGSDEGSGDEEEDGGPDEYEIEGPIEELPAEEEIHRQVNRVHRRQMLEDDQRNIELLQEALMGGEEIAPRERKFRWKNIDASMTEDLLKSDDEDSNHGHDPHEVIEDSQWMKERLEREEFLEKNSAERVHSEDSQLLSLGRKVVMSRQNSSATSIENSNQTTGGARNGRLSVDETSSSRDGFKMKGGRGSFLRRSQGVLAKLASYQELKNINGPRNSDKMLFKAVSPKPSKQTKRKDLSDVGNQTTREPPRKRKKIICMNEDSNSVFDLM